MENDNFNWFNYTTANGWAWLLAGIPAILAWIAVAICWFVEPRLAMEVSPLTWAMYVAMGWYGLLIAFFSGWFGLWLLFAVG